MGCSAGVVRRLIRKGEIVAVKYGETRQARVFVDEDSMTAFVDRCLAMGECKERRTRVDEVLRSIVKGARHD